ncbi:MAG: GntR family transcriptional regulator [Rhodosalinus sp.]|uniref:GntR family transcriptional regulator n=1 Tax=Rhodosalinus sp. TaxID=2047741 RepID=UPI00397ABE7F
MERERRTVRYQEILDTLRARIGRGDYAVGGSLPSEAELCREFGASRFTVREALRRLQNEGLVARRQGAGSTVIRQSARGAFVQSYGTIDQILQFARETDYRRISCTEERIDADLAARIGGAEGEVWTCLRGLRLRRDTGEALALIESYVPPALRAHAAAIEKVKPPFYPFLEEAIGERVTEMVQEVAAGEMPGDVARALGLEAGAITLCILRRYETAQRVLIASFNWHPDRDRFVYRSRLTQAGPPEG